MNLKKNSRHAFRFLLYPLVALLLFLGGCQSLQQLDNPEALGTKHVPLVVKHGPPAAAAQAQSITTITTDVEYTFSVLLPRTADDASISTNLRAYKGEMDLTSGGDITFTHLSTPVTDWFSSSSPDFDGNETVTLQRGYWKPLDFELDSEFFEDEEIKDGHYLVILGRTVVGAGTSNERIYEAIQIYAVDSPYEP